jgi:hypothetical protein
LELDSLTLNILNRRFFRIVFQELLRETKHQNELRRERIAKLHLEIERERLLAPPWMTSAIAAEANSEESNVSSAVDALRFRLQAEVD